jgi:hypothetical protein
MATDSNGGSHGMRTTLSAAAALVELGLLCGELMRHADKGVHRQDMSALNTFVSDI